MPPSALQVVEMKKSYVCFQTHFPTKLVLTLAVEVLKDYVQSGSANFHFDLPVGKEISASLMFRPRMARVGNMLLYLRCTLENLDRCWPTRLSPATCGYGTLKRGWSEVR